MMLLGQPWSLKLGRGLDVDSSFLDVFSCGGEKLGLSSTLAVKERVIWAGMLTLNFLLFGSFLGVQKGPGSRLDSVDPPISPHGGVGCP